MSVTFRWVAVHTDTWQGPDTSISLFTVRKGDRKGFFTMTSTSQKITIDVNSKLVWFARSPLYVVVSALTGVSVSFAPLFLYWSGKGKFFPDYGRVIVPLCFAVIYVVPLFYFVIGQRVASELRRLLDPAKG